MTRVIQVLHHSLRESRTQPVNPRGWNAVLAEQLAKRSSEFEIECWGPDRFLAKAEAWEDKGVRHRMFPSSYIRYGIEFSPGMAMELRRSSWAETIVHLHGVYNLNTYALSALLGNKVPIVAQFHDPPDSDGLASVPRSMVRELALSSVRSFLSPSEAMKASLPRRLGARTQVLPFGVDTSLFRSSSKRNARKALGLVEDMALGLFVGRLVPAKGVEGLVRAVPLILKAIPRFRLTIVGEGPLTGALRTLALALGVDAHVVMTGPVEHSLLPTYYNAADLLVHPSLRDAAPTVILESLACGIPVIATPQGYVPEVANRAGGILLLTDASAESIAERVVASLSFNDPAKTIRSEGLEAYGWDSAAPRFLSLYRNLARAHPKARLAFVQPEME